MATNFKNYIKKLLNISEDKNVSSTKWKRVTSSDEFVEQICTYIHDDYKQFRGLHKNDNSLGFMIATIGSEQPEKIQQWFETNSDLKTCLVLYDEDEILTKEEFQARKNELTERVKKLEEEKAPLLVTLSDDIKEELPYEFIKSILENFSKVLTESSSREQQKKLLHMIISEITINELREIDSIKININDNLVNYLSKEEGVSIKETPSSFTLSNVGINILNLYIVI